MAHLYANIRGRPPLREEKVHLPKVDETPSSKENDMASVGHRVPIHLGLDINGLLGVRLEPSNVDLDIEVTDASQTVSQRSPSDK